MSWSPYLYGSVAGVVLAMGLSELASPRPSVTEARLISDAHGAIAEICIQYRQDFHPAVVETLCDLFQGLGDDVRLFVIVEKASEFEFLKRDLAARGVKHLNRLTATITGFPITPWARDRFGAMRIGSRTVIAAPPARSDMPGPRGGDERVPEILAASLPGALCLPLPFMFEGGDLLADEQQAFIAETCLARNSPENVDHRQGLIRRMEQTLKKKIVVIGETPEDVPDHHICMYLTPLGENVVAVADPALGLELARRSTTVDMTDIETDTSKYKPFLNVIQYVEKSGLRVIRVPFLLTRTPRVYVSYNNAAMERQNGIKRLYMPVYDIPEIDRAASKVFEAEGWQVTPVRVAKLYHHTGSLRCQVGIIRRQGDQ